MDSYAAVRALGLALVLILSPAHARAQETPRPAERAPRAAEDLLICIVSAGSRLVSVGARGHILYSDDRGATWTQADVPVSSLLTSVTFVDERRGWAVGHDAVILQTTDGGQTWRLQQFDPKRSPLLDVLFLDAERGYAVGAYGQMLATEDGGAHWNEVTNDLTEEGVHFNALGRLGDGSLLLVGEQGMLAISDDGGRQWTRLASPYDSSLFTFQAIGERGALIAGLRGNVFVSTDVRSGEWQRVQTDSVQSVFGTSAAGDVIWLAGLNQSLLAVMPNLQVRSPDLRRLPAKIDDDQGLKPRREQEGASYADVLALSEGVLITVGDAGVKRWSVGR
ncbi:Uncharacterized protein SAMN04488120_10974 [Fontimonas thermophila]|uniref:Photosynthesis system II assembly factor Ycf48/Hcf136-like domain-containing protein n=1 Tax=Fontimonas thermophila TaxID=1076937 RepID=A0A1I2JW96_9GAMM|nr:YCF48-related protein [Fontimonas thermophila]SFF57081.1 Uncharacterized protein SAMN04488120_10974 [Fontimonas thermophila]